jgi:hypothetical protein
MCMFSAFTAGFRNTGECECFIFLLGGYLELLQTTFNFIIYLTSVIIYAYICKTNEGYSSTIKTCNYESF